MKNSSWLLADWQAQPWLDLEIGSYFPTWIEVVGVVGMAALGVVLFLEGSWLGPKKTMA